MSFWKKNGLLFVVFLTGAAVLVVEVLAVRILSPYYGNTIFTVSGVLSVILAALSVGYYIGGRLADKHPSEKLFFGIILISGLLVLLLQLFTVILLPALGHKLSMASGPLISSMVMFFVPSFLLGMLSPFTIKLQQLRLSGEGIGTISGRIFFWSTLGSIVGSLMTGFVLIPNLGVNEILIYTGAVLVLLGLLPILKIGLNKKTSLQILLIVFMISLTTTGIVASEQYSDEVVHIEDGVYQKILIYDTEDDEGRPVRVMQQDRSPSSAMFLNSDELVFEYSKYYPTYQLFKPELKEALIIGGAAYSIPKVLLEDIEDVTVDVVEIEPSLYKLSQEYFRLPDDPRLNNHVEDGRRFLANADKKYDLIFGDAYYSRYSIPAHLTTKEFFELAKEKLTPGGIFMGNFLGRFSDSAPSILLSEIKTFAEVFPNGYYIATQKQDYDDYQNVIFIGYNSDEKIDFDTLTIREHENPIISNLPEHLVNIDSLDLEEHILFTDNYAPVDFLTAKAIKNTKTSE